MPEEIIPPAAPLVSVLLTFYNGEKFLAAALESIARQSFTDFECIIVDDASTDSSAAVAFSFIASDSRFRIIKNNTNIGLTRSLNRALALARGVYGARLDADDVMHQDRLKLQVAFLEAHTEVGLVGSGYREINSAGQVRGEKFFPTSHEALKLALIRYNQFCHSAVLFRLALVRTLGGYSESFRRAQDYDLWLRLGAVTRLANLKATLVDKRYSGDNISIKNENEQLRCALRARYGALKRGQYPWWCLIFFIRPLVALLFPRAARNFIRRVFLGRQTYA